MCTKVGEGTLKVTVVYCKEVRDFRHWLVMGLYRLYMWRRQWYPTLVLLPGKAHGRRSLVGCSPWGHKESDTTERLPFHFSFSYTGEGNGNPLQCSCLENPRDGGAWWAAVSRVAQSRPRLKRLSSSRCRLLHIEQIYNKVLLFRMERYADMQSL